jgi:hypothetical protein
MVEPVTWRQDATTERWLRGLFLAGAGAAYGALALFLGAVGLGMGVGLLRGSWELRLVFVVLLVVGGPFSLLYLVPALASEGRLSFGPADAEPVLSRRALVAVGGVGAALLLGVGWLAPAVAAGLFGVGLLAGIGYLACATRGRLDPATATLVVHRPEREVDLGRVTGYRVRRLGPVALVTLDTPGAFATPAALRVPSDRLAAVTDALDAVVAGNVPDEGRDPNPAVRAVALGLALLFVAVGMGALLLVEVGIAWYVALLSWLFAGIFGLVAREG